MTSTSRDDSRNFNIPRAAPRSIRNSSTPNTGEFNLAHNNLGDISAISLPSLFSFTSTSLLVILNRCPTPNGTVHGTASPRILGRRRHSQCGNLDPFRRGNLDPFRRGVQPVPWRSNSPERDKPLVAAQRTSWVKLRCRRKRPLNVERSTR